MDTEEDLYNEIFKALKHPIRRHILSLLHDEPQSYSNILRALNIDTGLLNYHLENLGSLIAKDGDGKYGVSEFGRAAIRLKDGVEAPRRGEQPQPQIKRREIFIFTIVLFSLIVLGSSVYEQRQLYLREVEWDDTVLTKILMSEQSRLPRIESTLDEVIKDRLIKVDQIKELSDEVERASLNYARIVYVDEPHLELWSGASEAFTLFDNLLSDMKMHAYAENIASIPLDQTGWEKLQTLRDRIAELDSALFPVNISREVNPWTDDSYRDTSDAVNVVESLKTSIAQSWVICSRMSAILSPETQARELIVEAVGEEYFREYFELWIIEHNTWEPEEWLTGIVYLYHITVGDYNATREVYFHFDKMNRLIMAEGVPRAGNLMPFSVTRERAIEVASGNVTRQYVEVDAEIFYKKKTYDGLSVDRYVWSVQFYHTVRDAWSGSATSVYVDPVSGEVLGLDDYNWAVTP